MITHPISLAEYECLANEVKATKNPEQEIKINTSNATMSTAMILKAMMS